MAEQVTSHKLPPDRGAGKVVLYEVKGGHAPEVVNPESIEGRRWVLVLFPERVAWWAKSRAAGVREAKGNSPSLEALLDKRTISKKKPAAKKAKKDKGVVRARAHTKSPETQETKAAPPESEPKNEDKEEDKGKVPIPPDATFDQAMDIRFSVQRLMDDLDDLVTASLPVYSKEGDYIGDKPDYQTRLGALKTAISYREGLARAREKQQNEPKRISVGELESMLLESPQACETLERMIHKARAHQSLKKAVKPSKKS
jgi:hypothetical protein